MAGRLEPFEMTDLESMNIQAIHRDIAHKIIRKPFVFHGLMVGRWSWTYWLEAGVPLACAGILPNHTAWAFLGADMRRHMVPAVRAVRRVLGDYAATVGPVRCDIDSRSPEAVRWAKLLGFRPETGERWIFP